MCHIADQYRIVYSRSWCLTQLRNYILSVVCMALICAVIQLFFEKSAEQKPVIQFILGLVMTLTVLKPIYGMDLSSWEQYLNELSYMQTDAVYAGEESSRKAISQRITEQTRTYILDKAASMGAQIELSVELSDDTLPVPLAITVSGSVSPYAKHQLKRIIATDIGIPEDKQLWI